MAKHVPPTRFPDAVTASYYRSIDKLVQEVGKATLAVYDTQLKEYIDSNRADSSGFFVADSLFDSLKRVLNQLSKAIEQLFSQQKATKAAELFMKNLNQNNKTNMEQQGRIKGINPADTEPWLTPFMRENVEKNVGYITNIRDDYTKKIENIVLNGVNNGSSHKQIRQQLEEQIDMSRRRAEFVAVDQTGSLFGQMTAQRHQNMGVERFKWRTSKDERVRKSHKELEDKIFSYDDPPAVGLPGEDFRCRCIAIPVFDDEEEIESTTEQPVDEELTEEETRAINQYISSDSYKLNDKLRNGLPLDKQDVVLVNHLDTALQKMPKYEGDLSRSLYFYSNDELNNFMSSHMLGSIVMYNEFISTTKGDIYNFDGQVQLYILDSANGRNISHFNEGEQEILYERGSKFKVESIEEINGIYHILLEEYNE
ncbi:minor capsid protein [Lysinibacillus macroides]|nr:minor capsid protein [Lysinibacillus macroides]QPR69594.1 minor capsid protein [Lysinibacillus macroides]